MSKRFMFGFAVLLALPLWGQTGPADESESPVAASSPMIVPAAVSVIAYPTAVGSETRSNILSGGLAFDGAYIDNMEPGASAQPIGEKIFSLRPTLHLDESTSRLHQSWTYSPGFTWYAPSSSLNEVDQTADAGLQYRTSPHTVINLTELLRKTSTSFNQFANGGGISGSLQPSTVPVLAPSAQQLQNVATGQFAWQFDRTGMFGASALDTELHFPNSAQVPGLFDSNTRGISAFYALQASEKQYLGASYQYADALAYPQHAQSATVTHTISLFYSAYPVEHLSFTVVGGPQLYRASYTATPASSSWVPAVLASMGWQGSHSSFSASYGRQVTGGGGLLGAYRTSTASGVARLQISHAWITGVSCAYAQNKSVDLQLSLGEDGGHTISGSAMIQHALTRQLDLQFEYDRAHESYIGIAAVAQNPDSNQESASISWRFSRPLGR